MLSWMPPSVDENGNPITGQMAFSIYRSQSAGTYGSQLATGLSGAAYDDTTVLPGQTYHYAVTATVGGIESLKSADAAAVIPAQ